MERRYLVTLSNVIKHGDRKLLFWNCQFDPNTFLPYYVS